mmetsp:Transcript_87979/g.221405  ORF Transcript_87979/g.221405 Transcript_87979/m.221405 type:complete len:486 (-) Transcript_87979:45-1502(-)
MLVLCVLALAFGASGSIETLQQQLPLSGLTPYQKARLEAINRPASVASKAAELELKLIFAAADFRRHLAANDEHLAQLSPEELLSQVKANLETVEFTFAFGANPQNPLPYAVRNISTYDEWGILPNNWQLKATLQSTKDLFYWELYDAAEVDFYGLKPFAHQDVVTNASRFPSFEEAAERPLYALMNFRRIGLGYSFFGPYQFVYRNDIVRKRSELLPFDSGLVETCCNNSIPIPAEKHESMCGHLVVSPSFCELASTPPPQVPGKELDALLRNMKVSGLNTNTTVSQAAAKTVWQLVSPSATYSPVEIFNQLEAAVLGAVTTDDVKLVVADFTNLFGTHDGDQLVIFCQKHELPLAWSGSPQYDPEAPQQACGTPRYLDPATMSAANATRPPQGKVDFWDSVSQEVRAFRANQPKTGWQEQMALYWRKLEGTETTVLTARAGDCASFDLCFGMESRDPSPPRCVCRRPPQQPAAAAATSISIVV